MKQKKIILSTYTFLPDIGGVATNTLAIAEAFIAKGYDVTVVTLTKTRCQIDSKMKVIRSPNLLQLFQIYLSGDWILFSNLSIKLCWPVIFMHKKSALHHHSSSAFNRNTDSRVIPKIKRFIENKVISKSIHFVNSHFTKQDGGSFFDGLSTYLTYPIVQNESFSAPSLIEYKKRKNAIFVGRIEEEKGVLFLIENFQLIKKHLNIDCLYLAGDGSLLSELEMNKVEGVKFLGSLELEAVHELMSNAAYVFVPSIWKEPFGMVAVEGLVSGAIVISSDRGGLPEALGNCAALFDLDSRKSFTHALSKAKLLHENCIQDVDFLLSYTKSVHTHIKAFSANTVINVMINALEHK